jgi:hypothetical protein
MSTAKVDSKKRIVLPNGKPGEIYDVQQLEDGRLLLIRLERPEPNCKLNEADCLKAMREAPLSPKMSWDQLRGRTRNP